jgi:nucleotide-binding universal stress UspA family protein
MRRHLLLFSIILGCAPAAVSAQRLPAAADSSARGAETAARAWLGMLDRARWDSAYVHVVPVLRASIRYEDWAWTVFEARSALRPLSERRLTATEGAGTMFPGRSYLLRFELATTLDPATTETVVMVREQATWKVGGYGVRR